MRANLKYYKREYYYYNYFSKFQELSFYNNILDKPIDKKLPFEILNKDYINSLKTTKSILEKYGKPVYKDVSKNNKLHLAFFYTNKKYAYNIVKGFHFFEGELFFINISFKGLKKHKKQIIIDKVKELYNVSCKTITDIKIEDASGNIFYIEDLFDLSFYIILNNENNFIKAKEQFEKYKKEIKQKEDEFLSEFFKNLI